MKNYLVKSLFKIKNSNWGFKDRSNEHQLYENYLEMHRLSVASHKKYLQSDWELKFVGGEVESVQHAFKKTWFFIYELWRSEKCNILYTDPDTLVINNLNVWDQFKNFMMFNFTDPKQLLKDDIKIPYFFNCGVRYYPSTMILDVWDYGNSLVKVWDENIYDTEQIILNRMLWCQNLKIEQVLFPTLAYQAHLLPEEPLWKQDIWNGISINDASVIHFHGSRNSDIKLKLMRQIYETKRIHIS